MDVQEEVMTSLEGFTVVKMLALLKDSNTVVLHCLYRETDAVVLVSKKIWTEETARHLFSEGASNSLSLDLHNAEYYDFTSVASTPLKVSIQWPAKQWHIDKWAEGQFWLVRETEAMYKAATLPYVSSIPSSKNAWIDNIFDGTKEADRVIFLDKDPKNGMVIVFDSKMDLADPSSIYLQCILRDAALQSVRDFNGSHVSLLKSAQAHIFRVMQERFGCSASKLRLYVHYYPTFWQAHIHIQHTSFPIMGGSTSIGKAIALEDVIQNLECKSDYYQRATLVSSIKSGTPHHAAFVSAGISLE